MSAHPEFDAYVTATNAVDDLLPRVAHLYVLCESRQCETQEALDEARNLLLDNADALDAAIETMGKAANAWTARVRRKVMTDRMAGLPVVTGEPPVAS